MMAALQRVEDNKTSCTVIHSESAATIQTIKEARSETRPDLITETSLILCRINKIGCEVGFIWIPAHVAIQGNEEADTVAKNAIEQENVKLELEFGPPEHSFVINQAAKETWQNSWDKEHKGRTFYSIQKRIGESNGCSRRDAVVITRSRLGHCGLRSGRALIGKHPDGQCERGQTETVTRVIVQRKSYSFQRRTLFRDMGAAGETVFNTRTLLNLEDCIHMKKLL